MAIDFPCVKKRENIEIKKKLLIKIGGFYGKISIWKGKSNNIF